MGKLDSFSPVPDSVKQDPSSLFILAPSLTDEAARKVDKNLLLSNEFGKGDTIQQLKSILQKCFPSSTVNIINITLDNMIEVLKDIQLKKKNGENLCVMNLCDGTETDGYPGLTAVKFLEDARIPFTGADSVFYKDTTSKPFLKQKLVAAGVPTAIFLEIRAGHEHEDLKEASNLIGWPMIIKPSVSYASLSITDKSVVNNLEEAITQTKNVLSSTEGGVFVETFLQGREFTALCTGSERLGVTVYPVAERVFNSQLEDSKRILAFDRYWDGYGLDGSKPAEDSPQLYWYEKAPESWQEALEGVARKAYIACGGSGYGRVDIRTRSKSTPDAFVLEVNANCGLSFGKNSSSLGEILELSQISAESFCASLIDFAIRRT